MPISEVNYFSKEAKKLSQEAVIKSGLHALTAVLFLTNPITGAIVGGTRFLAGKAIDHFCEKQKIAQEGTLKKTVQWLLSSAGSIALGAFAANALGLSITLLAATCICITTSTFVTKDAVISAMDQIIRKIQECYSHIRHPNRTAAPVVYDQFGPSDSLQST